MMGGMTVDLPEVLRGPRLDLVLVTVDQLLSRDEGREPVPLGYDDPDDVLSPGSSPLHVRSEQVRADPGVNAWLLRLAVDRELATIVGYGNFHDAPDDRGMVEVGYAVLPRWRRRGYGREIALTLWRHAVGHPDVHVLRASVSPGNTASQSIIGGAGLRKVGEQWDDEDGLEWVFEVPVSAARLG
jgi:RimJ/RimL family protein N-acetyltransferase